jgi:hypothetical protein
MKGNTVHCDVQPLKTESLNEYFKKGNKVAVDTLAGRIGNLVRRGVVKSHPERRGE